VISTVYGVPFLDTPFPWVFGVGLFCAAALNRALRPASYPRWRASDPERALAAKWSLFTLYLALAVALALAAVFVPGAQKIRDMRLLYFFLATLAFFFLVFRFKRSVGPAAVILLFALVITVVLFLQSLSAFTGETDIGRVRVLGLEPSSMKLEIIPAGKEPVITTMAGSYFAPVVRVVIFDDYFVFLGAKTWYRFEGMSSFAVEKTEAGSALRQQQSDYYFPYPNGLSERLYRFYERYDNRIPGVRSVQVEMDLKKARDLATYALLIQNDGGLQIVERR
jgi:hypothetical protein